MLLSSRRESQREKRCWKVRSKGFFAFFLVAATAHADWADILREDNPGGKTKKSPAAAKAAKPLPSGPALVQSDGIKTDGESGVPDETSSINPVFARERKELERKMSVILNRIPDTDPDKGVWISVSAALYANLGEFGRAEEMTLKGVALAEKTGGQNSKAAIEARRNLSKLYFYVGDYERCLKLDTRNVRACEENPALEKVHQAACYAQLAQTLRKLGHLEAAAENADKSVALGSEDQTAQEYERLVLPLSVSADVAVAAGDTSKAEAVSLQLIEILEPVVRGDETKTRRKRAERVIQDTRFRLAELYLIQGRNGEARHQLEMLDAYYRANPIGKDTVDGMQLEALQAVQAWATGRPEDATRHAKTYLQFHQKFLPSALTMAESQRLGWQQKHLDFTLPVELCEPSELADLVLQWKGVVLESLMADRAANAPKGGDEGTEKNAGIADARRRLAQLSLMQSFGSEVSPELLDELKRKLDAEQKAEAGAKSSGPVAGSGSLLPRVQQSLPPGSALVEFVFYRQLPDLRSGPRMFGVLVISGAEEPEWIPLGPVAPLESLLSDLDVMLESPENSDERASHLLSKVYGAVWQKIDESLPAGTSRVYVSPDGTLQFLPFACLLAADGRFVSDRYGIVYVGSGRDLLRPGSPANGKTISIFADPDFERSPILAKKETKPSDSQMRFTRGADMVLPRLPGTALEAAEIQKAAGETGWSSTTLLGAEASERNLLKLPRVTILHLATHGFYLGDNISNSGVSEPTRGMSIEGTETEPAASTQNRKLPAMFASGLALAGAKETINGWKDGRNGDASDDGVITAEEILGLDLADARLVTLSACDTGAGESRSGEGVFGLRRAFMLAGSDNLLMSLWPVGDQITAEIMADFYRKAFESGDLATAFTETQRNWLERLRSEKGVAVAVREAGPFVFAAMATSDVPASSVSSESANVGNGAK
jgi:CHAT domain-containing protein/tetratricopeptide (TPR) repeat protein